MKVLYVRNSKKDAITLIEGLGLSPTECYAIGVGESICGLGFDTIIFDVDVHWLMKQELTRYNEWQQHVINRLNDRKKGKIIYIQ